MRKKALFSGMTAFSVCAALLFSLLFANCGKVNDEYIPLTSTPPPTGPITIDLSTATVGYGATMTPATPTSTGPVTFIKGGDSANSYWQAAFTSPTLDLSGYSSIVFNLTTKNKIKVAFLSDNAWGSPTCSQFFDPTTIGVEETRDFTWDLSTVTPPTAISNVKFIAVCANNHEDSISVNRITLSR